MYRVVIVYASMTGNTEAITTDIARHMTSQSDDIQVEMKEQEGAG